MSKRRLVGANEWVDVPGLKCPECEGAMFLEIVAWGDDGKPHEILLGCKNEEDTLTLLGDAGMDEEELQEYEHRHWQGEWQPAIDAAELWAKKTLRVRP